ncbi:MAG: trehalose-6-phosphate synthase [Candidatus Taylorbacteria bacterium]|nr:trehalose-6-phosphate synthase [Candidatus Taylorbacteria bacterium]
MILIAGLILVVILTVFGITAKQINDKKESETAALEYRTRLLADSLKEAVEPYYAGNSTSALQKIVDKYANKEHVVGLAVYDSKGGVVAASADLPKMLLSTSTTVTRAMDTDKSTGDFIKDGDRSIYVFAEPLHQNERVVGAFLVAQNAAYIETGIQEILESNLIRVFIQIVLFLALLYILIHWLIWRPISRLADSIKTARLKGRGEEELANIQDNIFFRPLVGEISKITKSLSEARLAASEEARMRLEKLDSPWTAERLKEFIKAYLKDRKIFVVSNREPFVHKHTKKGVVCEVPASGMVTALEPIMEACGGLWLAHGSGDADKELSDSFGKLAVPPDDPKYTLKRIWLSEEEIRGHYLGFSNEALWPLCHMAHTRPIFNKNHWEEYRKVNQKFADALLVEIKRVERPLAMVQDFHFALIPKLIKDKRPDAQICLFWHIPWPNAELFSICPWRKEILEGMLGADIIGFHTQQYCNNFLDTVGKEMESLIDLERFSISRDNHVSYIKPFPISIAFSGAFSGGVEDTKESDRRILENLRIKTKYLGLGVDRLDYIKGIVERFAGIEIFFEKYPDYRKQFTFLQISPMSREGVEKYREYAESVEQEAQRINQKFGDGDWKPIVLIERHHSHKELEVFYRLADVCLVTSLHDGMNLVAKEFVAAREDDRGVLILSHFTGAARDLKGSLLINPYNAEETASVLYYALNMSLQLQASRMKMMRASVKNYNIYRWSAELIKSIAGLQ